jgi:hypothetical protein
LFCTLEKIDQYQRSKAGTKKFDEASGTTLKQISVTKEANINFKCILLFEKASLKSGNHFLMYKKK